MKDNTYKFYSKFNDVDNIQLQGHNRAHILLNIIEDLTEKGKSETECIHDVKAYLSGISKREMYHVKVWLDKLLTHHPYIKLKEDLECDVPFVILH